MTWATAFLESYIPVLIQRGLSVGDSPAEWAIKQLCRWVEWYRPPYEVRPGQLWTSVDGKTHPDVGGIVGSITVRERDPGALRPWMYQRFGPHQRTAWEHRDLDGHRDRLREDFKLPDAWVGPVAQADADAVLQELERRGVRPCDDARRVLEGRLQKCAVFWWASNVHNGPRARGWEGLPSHWFARDRNGNSQEAYHCRREIESKRVEFRSWDWCGVTRTEMYFSEPTRFSYHVHVPWSVLQREGWGAVPPDRQVGAGLDGPKP